MRFLVAGLVLGAGVANADPSDSYVKPWDRHGDAGVFLEVGGGWQRLASHGITYRAEYVRFAPQISLTHYLYLGAALQYGHVYGAYGAPDDPLSVPIVLQTGDNSNGEILEPQVFLGVRNLIGIFSGGAEVAPTLRWLSAGVNSEYMTNAQFLTTIELHARGDIWPTPHVSAGVMVGMDISSIRDFQAGLQIGFHFEPYDAMNRR
ncbi:MAG: hypothetical protein ABJE66_06685 [Deltaproteobacteria bacterium]